MDVPAPARTRRRPERADVRVRVLDAARAEFAEVGYHRASLSTIAQEAGFSKGAVYSNFASKEDLFLALVGDELSVRADRLALATRRARTVEGTVTALARAIVAMVVDGWQQNVLFAEFRSSAMRDPQSAQTLGRIRSLLTDSVAARLTAQARAMDLRLAVPPRHAATLVLAMVNGLSLEQIGQDRPVVTSASVAVVLRSLFGLPPATHTMKPARRESSRGAAARG